MPCLRRGIFASLCRCTALVGIALAWCASLAHVTAESVAPEITPARLEVDVPVPPGSEVDLPPLVVRNRGMATLHARMGTSTDRPEEAGWLRFEPEIFILAPDERRVVRVRARIPSEADLGPRLFRLRASVDTAPEPGGVAIGITAAVASMLILDVGWPDASVDTASPGGTTEAGNVGLLSARLWLLILAAFASGAVSWTLATYAGQFEIVIRRRPSSTDDDPD